MNVELTVVGKIVIYHQWYLTWSKNQVKRFKRGFTTTTAHGRALICWKEGPYLCSCFLKNCLQQWRVRRRPTCCTSRPRAQTSVVIKTRVVPDRNSAMIASRSFWGISPCMADTVKLLLLIFSVSQSTCVQDHTLQWFKQIPLLHSSHLPQMRYKKSQHTWRCCTKPSKWFAIILAYRREN